MKKPEDYLLKYNCKHPDDVALLGSRVIELIKQAQIDAINTTIYLCVDEAKSTYIANKSIGDTDIITIVDKQSLINVGEKLKQNLL